MFKSKFKVGDYVVSTKFNRIYQVESIVNRYPNCIYYLKVIKYCKYGFMIGNVYQFSSQYIDANYFVCKNISELLAKVI